MRRLIRMLLLLLIFAALFPFVYPWKNGKPMLSWSDIKMPTMPPLNLPELPALSLPGGDEATREPHQPVKLYRWQGPDGSMQFSNQLPPEGVSYEVVEVNPDANMIQPMEESGGETNVRPETTDQPATSLSIPSPLTISPGETLQLIEDARNVRQLSEERLQQQEALTQ